MAGTEGFDMLIDCLGGFLAWTWNGTGLLSFEAPSASGLWASLASAVAGSNRPLRLARGWLSFSGDNASHGLHKALTTSA